MSKGATKRGRKEHHHRTRLVRCGKEWPPAIAPAGARDATRGWKSVARTCAERKRRHRDGFVGSVRVQKSLRASKGEREREAALCFCFRPDVQDERARRMPVDAGAGGCVSEESVSGVVLRVGLAGRRERNRRQLRDRAFFGGGGSKRARDSPPLPCPPNHESHAPLPGPPPRYYDSARPYPSPRASTRSIAPSSRRRIPSAVLPPHLVF